MNLGVIIYLVFLYYNKVTNMAEKVLKNQKDLKISNFGCLKKGGRGKNFGKRGKF